MRASAGMRLDVSSTSRSTWGRTFPIETHVKGNRKESLKGTRKKSWEMWTIPKERVSSLLVSWLPSTRAVHAHTLQQTHALRNVSLPSHSSRISRHRSRGRAIRSKLRATQSIFGFRSMWVSLPTAMHLATLVRSVSARREIGTSERGEELHIHGSFDVAIAHSGSKPSFLASHVGEMQGRGWIHVRKRTLERGDGSN